MNEAAPSVILDATPTHGRTVVIGLTLFALCGASCSRNSKATAPTTTRFAPRSTSASSSTTAPRSAAKTTAGPTGPTGARGPTGPQGLPGVPGVSAYLVVEGSTTRRFANNGTDPVAGQVVASAACPAGKTVLAGGAAIDSKPFSPTDFAFHRGIGTPRHISVASDSRMDP